MPFRKLLKRKSSARSGESAMLTLSQL